MADKAPFQNNVLRPAGKLEQPVLFLPSMWAVSLPVSTHHHLTSETNTNSELESTSRDLGYFQVLGTGVLPQPPGKDLTPSWAPFSPTCAVAVLQRPLVVFSYWFVLPSPTWCTLCLYLDMGSIFLWSPFLLSASVFSLKQKRERLPTFKSHLKYAIFLLVNIRVVHIASIICLTKFLLGFPLGDG